MKAPALANPRGRSRASQALVFGAMVVVPLAVALVVAMRIWNAVPLLPSPALAGSTPPEPAGSAPDDPTPEIRGRILDADGNAVNGATVRLVSTSPPYTVYRKTPSNAAGAFSFPHVGPWRGRVVADHDPEG